MDEDRPIFLQIAEQIENDIIAGQLAEETQVPSTNEFAAFHRINPATAAKGVNLLVDDGILYKKRGIGMFVAEGAARHARRPAPRALPVGVRGAPAGRGREARHLGRAGRHHDPDQHDQRQYDQRHYEGTRLMTEVIKVDHLTRRFRPIHRHRRCDLQRRAEPHLRVARAQRRGQDHDDAAAHRAGLRLLRRHPRVRREPRGELASARPRLLSSRRASATRRSSGPSTFSRAHRGSSRTGTPSSQPASSPSSGCP